MATWIVGIVVVLIVAGVIWKMVSDKRNGKGGCGGNWQPLQRLPLRKCR